MTTAKKWQWIQKKALLLLHEESLAQFGGARGLRDAGFLDSALASPLSLLAYPPDCGVADLAAVYGYGLAKNHAFVDGNKRAAFLSVGLFLKMNGYALKADQVDAIQTMLALAAGSCSEADFARWIADHLIS